MIKFQGSDILFTINFNSSVIPSITGFDSYDEINIYISTSTSKAYKIPFSQLTITPEKITGDIQSSTTAAILGELLFGIELKKAETITDAELNIYELVNTGIIIKPFKK